MHQFVPMDVIKRKKIGSRGDNKGRRGDQVANNNAAQYGQINTYRILKKISFG
jgi:hypothetical protein